MGAASSSPGQQRPRDTSASRSEAQCMLRPQRSSAQPGRAARLQQLQRHRAQAGRVTAGGRERVRKLRAQGLLRHRGWEARPGLSPVTHPGQ
ncbi:hypothetical protein NDU88_002123 [Pleurodeles waltl]|uniref:Uncharacterized protein n=1 Tax=Pleurodeles waltl TaxID=8319 RepID=A0AAV7WKI3_PLEWA|nr:hypothetical protein NDU88_002123 [Pleurodeles waltl]